MKNTILEFLKSKTLWAVLTLQIIAIEPYLPLIEQHLPVEMGYVATLILPVAILWAKIIRDKGLLEELSKTTKKVVKSRAKKAVKKKVDDTIKKL